MGFLSGALGTNSADQYKQVVNGQQMIAPEVQAQQQQLANMLMTQAQGGGPSAATTMLNQQNQQNAANALGMAAGQRGVNSGLALRQALQANAGANQQTAAQASLARQQEMLNAQGLAGNQVNTMQQQDIGANMGATQINAGFASDAAKNNAGIFGGVLNAAGGVAAAAMADGGRVPGQAEVQGDSLANDKVPTMLSPGEIVIPRSHADSAAKAKEFVEHLMASKSKKSEGQAGYGKVLEAHRKAKAAMAELEKHLGKVKG